LGERVAVDLFPRLLAPHSAKASTLPDGVKSKTN